MAKLVRAYAFCNNEVAYLAWQANGRIDGCLGFMITRIHLDSGERRVLPTWVAFKTQSNAYWEEQDTSVWPVQKFSWRDLTLRRSRNTLGSRTGALRVKYEIRPVGLHKPGRAPVPPSATGQPGKYTGKPIPLFFCGAAIETNEITATTDFGAVSAAFNNGILSTQFLRKQLQTARGKAPSLKLVKARMATPSDPLRGYLAGDILPLLRTLFERAAAERGTVYLALYELSDPELIELLLQHQQRLRLILSTAGNLEHKVKGQRQVEWDTTNADARKRLRKLMRSRLQDRMFNNSSHIGHNKFAVLVVAKAPIAVWTGSTNWTSTGLCAQTNNCIVFESKRLAATYLEYWKSLHADEQPVPKPLSRPNSADQGPALRESNMRPGRAALSNKSGQSDVWFSPNTETTASPATRTVPPDLAVVFDCMRQAKQAILFLVFNPGRTAAEAGDFEDVNTAVSAALTLGRNAPHLTVLGAISDPTALPGYQAPPRRKKGAPKPTQKGPKIPLPAIFRAPGAPKVLFIRAAALRDIVGDLQRELLSAGHAIIHDKIVVIDPMSKDDCVVITGSHNLGFKASYANDENLLIIRKNQPLALAYATHVLDVYDHYKFRAVQEEITRESMQSNKPRDVPTGHGLLETTDSWQDKYFDAARPPELPYFTG